MIMFKRVAESIRQIDDRECLHLVLETLLVLVGILLAFELQEWASRHAEAAKHHELLERLFEESQSTVAVLRANRADMDRIVDREKSFATMLVHRNSCPPESMWGAVDTIPMYPPIAVPSTVYQEIMGSGGLANIPDPKVRQSVSYFRAQLDWVQAQNSNFRTARTIPLQPHDPRITLDFDQSADEPEISRYAIGALCQDHAFRNDIADSVRNHMAVASMRHDLVSTAIQMCATIGASLSEPCVPTFGGPLTEADAKTAADAVRKMSAPRVPSRSPRAPSRSASPSAPGAGRGRG
jgi:hypothetical protein